MRGRARARAPLPPEEWAVEPEPLATDVETGGTDPGGSTSTAADIDEGDELPDWATGLDAGGTEAAEVPDALDEVPDEPRPEEPRPEPTGWADPAPDTSGWDQLEDEPDTGALPDDPLPVMEPDPPPATEPDPLPVMEAQPAPVTEPEPPPPAEPEVPVPGFSFGKRDPMDKARRLARVLVSDMVMYNSERHQVALSNGGPWPRTSRRRSRSPGRSIVDQIGNEIAEGEGRHVLEPGPERHPGQGRQGVLAGGLRGTVRLATARRGRALNHPSRHGYIPASGTRCEGPSICGRPFVLWIRPVIPRLETVPHHEQREVAAPGLVSSEGPGAQGVSLTWIHAKDA
jgi:hypothetical protein